MVRILADENIPFAKEAFSTLGKVRTLSGHAIDANEVKETDVLLVRSVTPVGPALLQDANVRFVGSATSGTDHVDVAYLHKRGVAFAHAPGANANSVVEYVLAALLRLAVRRGEPLRGKTVGIVGVGAIGRRLAGRLSAFGVRVLQNDPPRAEKEGTEGFTSLGSVLRESDVVTLHVPLNRAGEHATHHLIGAAELNTMKRTAWLVNAARGAAVDNEALKVALRDEQIAAAVLDTWEGEPLPDVELVQRTALATPHIAGYAFDGKVRGTLMIYRALCEHLGEEQNWEAETVLTPGEPLELVPPDPALPETDALNWLTRQMYDIGTDDERLRGLLERPPVVQGTFFQKLRKTYPRRRAFARYRLPDWGVPPANIEAAVEKGLGVHLI